MIEALILLFEAGVADTDEQGGRDDLIAYGIVVPSPNWLWCNGSLWVVLLTSMGSAMTSIPPRPANSGSDLMTRALAICLFLFIAVPALSQSKGSVQPKGTSSAQGSKPASKTKSARSVKPSDLYSKVPFDTSIGKVPENFHGHDLMSLYFALAGKLRGKGEFETTEAYNKRMEVLLAEPVLGQLTPKSMLASVIGLTMGNEYSELQYSADAQSLSVKKSLDRVPIDIGNYKDYKSDQRVIPTGLDFEKTLRTYTGQNAYGTKRRVVEKEEFTCDLIMMNPDQFGFKRTDYDILGQNIHFDLPMDPGTAQKVKQNLKLLIIFQVGAPYAGNSKDYNSATIDNPVELTIHKFFVFADVKEIWLYDSKTGEVYARFPVKTEAPAAASGS